MKPAELKTALGNVEREANRLLRRGESGRAFGIHHALNLLADEFERHAMRTRWETYTEMRFESAHDLPAFPDGHKCRRLHGHSYRARIFVEATELDGQFITTDYAEIAAVVEPIRLALDHRYLNDIDGLENPTSEVIAQWIWRRLKPGLATLSKVRIFETCDSGCTYSE